MDMIYTKKVTILPSRLDVEGRLSVPDTFDLFMDTATQAAEAMGLGWGFLLKRGLFWITVKTRIRFLNPPRLLEDVDVVTWPEPPGETRCFRHYEIRRGGETLAQGKTEWAIVGMMMHKPKKMADIFPEGLEYPEARALPEPFSMIDERFDEPPFARHRVANTDIDMARHMNNVAYVRAIVNAFSVKEWQKLKLREMEIVFRASAREGDELAFQKRRGDGWMDIKGSLPDGTTSVLVRLYLG